MLSGHRIWLLQVWSEEAKSILENPIGCPYCEPNVLVLDRSKKVEQAKMVKIVNLRASEIVTVFNLAAVKFRLIIQDLMLSVKINSIL